MIDHDVQGRGSTFLITIDPGSVGGDGASKSKPREPSMSLTAGRPDLSGIRVLLADDARDIQALVARILNLAGADVDVVSNGIEAIERVNQDHNYDVILMDLQMPVMGGFEATTILCRDGYRGRIMALTAHAMNSEHQCCLHNGFDDHFSKPINRTALIERVDKLSRMPRVGQV